MEPWQRVQINVKVVKSLINLLKMRINNRRIKAFLNRAMLGNKKIVHDIEDVSALSWTLAEDEVENGSLRPTRSGMVDPSPHPMQQLVSNPGNPTTWKSVFAHLREEGVDLSVGENGNRKVIDDDNMLEIMLRKFNLKLIIGNMQLFAISLE